MVCHLPVIKKNFETKVARAIDIVRNLNATQINSCSRCHVGDSYVKTRSNFKEAARRNLKPTDASKKQNRFN